ncbi:arrestin domain-containing protein 5 [Chrysemys picta bellii]|uniref:arrestin domain-containing protein 5 n=1 Tax=Chrysemys picta bellii TaxID=8478 RepID=UPI000388E072|nr:arrestin domain-containing protein 5 [Chrysemys picta bellii]
MSVVKSINVVLPEEKVYLAGSSIAGQVILTLNNSLINPIVKVELVGRGYLEWNEETNADKDYSRDIICNNKADYINQTKTFYIEGNWLASGTHIFDFHFNLPDRLPSTFSSNIARVSYFLKASCATRELILAKQKKYLLVQGTSYGTHRTLPPLPIQYPLVVEVNKHVAYHCCFKHGLVILRISLVKNTFAPGEQIIFTTEIDNQTGRSIRKVVFALYSIILYLGYTVRAERRSLEDRNEVMRLESRTKAAPFEVTRITSMFSLPKLLSVSSMSIANEIMEVRYELIGTVYLPWSMTTIVAKVPIIIRTTAVGIPED